MLRSGWMFTPCGQDGKWFGDTEKKEGKENQRNEILMLIL